jgi:hypothetical protein
VKEEKIVGTHHFRCNSQESLLNDFYGKAFVYLTETQVRRPVQMLSFFVWVLNHLHTNRHRPLVSKNDKKKYIEIFFYFIYISTMEEK